MTTAPGRRDERASVLLLVPAALLIVLVMASIAVDMSLVHLRRRQAYDLAAGAANDAVTAAADEGSLRAGGYRVDPDRAQQVVERIVAASELAPDVAAPPTVRVTAEGVVVEVSLRADYIFAGVVPGAPDGTTVTASASATAAADAGP
ncbi:MAG TPA: hypothetical protein VFZ79_14115 [Acidimicrobiales bacterium]